MKKIELSKSVWPTYNYLVRFKNDCFPSVETIARVVGKSKRTIYRHLSRLEELGILSREERYRPNGSQSSSKCIFNDSITVMPPDQTLEPAVFDSKTSKNFNTPVSSHILNRLLKKTKNDNVVCNNFKEEDNLGLTPSQHCQKSNPVDDNPISIKFAAAAEIVLTIGGQDIPMKVEGGMSLKISSEGLEVSSGSSEPSESSRLPEPEKDTEDSSGAANISQPGQSNSNGSGDNLYLEKRWRKILEKLVPYFPRNLRSQYKFRAICSVLKSHPVTYQVELAVLVDILRDLASGLKSGKYSWEKGLTGLLRCKLSDFESSETPDWDGIDETQKNRLLKARAKCVRDRGEYWRIQARKQQATLNSGKLWTEFPVGMRRIEPYDAPLLVSIFYAHPELIDMPSNELQALISDSGLKYRELSENKQKAVDEFCRKMNGKSFEDIGDFKSLSKLLMEKELYQIPA